MANHPLKLGYKASAEQFGARQLINYAVEAERHCKRIWNKLKMPLAPAILARECYFALV
jgi:hypothetical protein